MTRVLDVEPMSRNLPEQAGAKGVKVATWIRALAKGCALVRSAHGGLRGNWPYMT